ncbi:CHAT domain-containing protein, partial [Acidobacteriia bacterium AH_259_A11_L15]|nr:CHAT domain-containing protein [Acidobacteriia bacterium AH_259_A11_L15]
SALAEQERLARATWRDVQQALQPGEAAVEFVRFPYHDGKQWTDQTYYVALIVTPETTTAPKMVVLGDADQLEGRALDAYRRLASEPQPFPGELLEMYQARVRQWQASIPLGADSPVYAAFWQPLEAALAGAERIYLSPDGILNVVSWPVIPAGDGGLLIDAYDLRVLSSTRDLLREKRTAPSDTAVLIGNPRFNLDEETLRAAARTFTEGEQLVAVALRGVRSRDQRRGGLESLA